MRFRKFQTINHKSFALYLFFLLILLRPLVDIFWWMKDTSPLLSPLNWAGVLPVPLIVLFLFFKIKDKRKKNKEPRTKDQELRTNSKWYKVQGAGIMVLFSVVVLVNAIGITIPAMKQFNNETINSFGLAAKLISFPLFFFFLYNLINKDSFDLILKIFLISTIFPF